MIGSLITRGLVLMFGYAYPAYECYKAVEMNKPDIEQLRFWCQYWILVAVITVCERIGDTFVGWLPMYGEAKLAFFIYLWYPKTKGTSYVYDAFFKPYVAQHEPEIDRNLSELRTRAGDMVVSYWQRAAGYGQTRIFEVLQYIASQSTPVRPVQPQQLENRLQKPTAPSIRRSVSAPQPHEVQPSSSDLNTPSSGQQEDTTEIESEPPQNPKSANVPNTSNEQKTTATAATVVLASKASSSTEEQEMQTDIVTSKTAENAQSTPQETIMEDAVRVTRARSRRTRGGSSR